MRPKHPWVRGRWTIRETEQSGSACRVSSVCLGAVRSGSLICSRKTREMPKRRALAPSLVSIRPHLVAHRR